MKEKLKIKKWELGFTPALLIILFLSVTTVIYQTVFQNGITCNGYLTIFTNPVLFLLNFLPVFLISILIFATTNSLGFAYVIPNSLLTVFLIINEYKILFRDEPLSFTDLALAGETTNIMANYTLVFPAKIILLPLIIIILSCIFFLFIRVRKSNWISKTITASISIIATIVLSLNVYSDYNYYHNIKIAGNEFRSSEVYAHKGFLYSFLASSSGSEYEKPEGYSDERVNEILGNYIPDESEKVPNVIAIMSEAFFDIQDAENLEFIPEENPFKKFNEIRNNSMYGSIFVPGFAGGTSQTEFEFLTGANISLVSKALPVMHNTHIKGSAYSLASAFEKKGFKTVTNHPGHDWFYNRRNVYGYMEFDESYFMENLSGEIEQINYYPTDRVATDMILESYKKHISESPDQGYFSFNVTIQNHGPYPNTPAEKIRVKRLEGMTDEEFNILCHYTNNLYDASELLYEITEYANTLEQPTVVVFFGDHLPFLDSEQNIYKKIGHPIVSDGTNNSEAYIRQHLTPYLIWGNNSFRNTNKIELPKFGGIISSNFLPAKLTEFMKVDLSSYFMYLKDVSSKIDVISPQVNIIKGVEHEVIPEELNDIIKDYKIMQYHNLKVYKKPAK